MKPLRHVQGIAIRPLSMMFVLVSCLALVIGGCGDDDGGNPLKPGPKPPVYPVLSDPQNVLAALEIAYAARDSTMYKQLHDSTYSGTSIDLQNPGNSINLTFSDEARHIAALASVPGLIAYLELGESTTWFRTASDDPSHPEWAVIQIVGSAYRVEIYDGADALGAVGEPGTFQEFAFSPREDSTSPTDTLWRIVRWRETGQSGPSPAP